MLSHRRPPPWDGIRAWLLSAEADVDTSSTLNKWCESEV